MKDEWNNECLYDFKNIMFRRWEVTSCPKCPSIVVNSEGNYYGFYYGAKWDGNNTIKSSDASYGSANGYFYTFALKDLATDNWFDYTVAAHLGLKNDEEFEIACHNNHIGNFTDEYISGNGCIAKMLNNIVFFNVYTDLSDTSYADDYSYCHFNTFGNYCKSNTFGNGCESNTFGNWCSSNIFGYNCDSNTFGNRCSCNTFGNVCNTNTFGNSCNYNTFENYCYSNTFKDGCNSNTFKDDCYSNTFGNSCYSNTLGHGCYSNTLGHGCYSNSFGDYSYSNTFRDDCYSNTFGDGGYSNTFGNSCYSNTFRDDCYSNTFGDDCYSNTFGYGCYYIKFGIGCCYIKFGNSSSTKSYYRYIIVENGNHHIYLDTTQTTSFVNQIQNVKIAQGVNNTTTYKTISHNTVKDTFQTVYGNNSSGVTVGYNPAD